MIDCSHLTEEQIIKNREQIQLQMDALNALDDALIYALSCKKAKETTKNLYRIIFNS